MKRRSFLKLSASASVFSILPHELQALVPSLPLDGCDFSNRKIILINLAGGNDGLNMVVPINQYDIYANLRPTIKVPNSGLKSYLNLDTTLPDEKNIGLNPALANMKSMYDNGLIRIIQGVGYPSQNKSHFHSNDIIMTGNDGNSWDNGDSSGWIGRFMESHYSSSLSQGYPMAVKLGSNKRSLGLIGDFQQDLDLNLTNQDISNYASNLTNNLSNPASILSSDFGNKLSYIIDAQTIFNEYSSNISTSYSSGINAVNYEDDSLSDQLKTVARLISGGLESKIYMVQLNGFDTHNNQIWAGNGLKGKHYSLLENLDQAISTFYQDLKNQNLHEDVIGLTYSEFGRKAKENGNVGTDHGEIAPMVLFGKPIEGGVSGINPDLSEAVSANNYQIQTVQHDYRQVFGSLMRNYLGSNTMAIDAAFIEQNSNTSFTEVILNDLIKSSYMVDESCINPIDNVRLSQLNNEDITCFQVFPNPCIDHVNISPINFDIEHVLIKLLHSNGKVLNSISLANAQEIHRIDLTHYPKGIYFIKIQSELNHETHKIVKM